MLSFTFATMRGGKSTALLQRRFNLMGIEKRVVVMTSSNDTRFGLGRVTSRMGPSCDAIAFGADHNFTERDFWNADELLIDEVQFCEAHQIKALHSLAWKLQVRVSCYGLRTDFRGDTFPGSAMLLGLADELHEITMLCQCGAKATMNQRIDKSGQPVQDGPVLEIGGDDRYRPVCPQCFN